MLFFINAWFDRAEPFVSVHNRETGQEVARFDHIELENHVQKGNLCLEDFCQADTMHQQALVKDLLLLQCCNLMRLETCPFFSNQSASCSLSTATNKNIVKQLQQNKTNREQTILT